MQKLIVMEIVYRKLSEIKPNPKNPRKAKPNAVAELAESIKENPDYFEARPILLSDRTGEFVIVGGERRSEAARQLGLDEVPTILLKGLTEEREDELMIIDNVHSGVWDETLLASWDKDKLQKWGVDLPRWEKEKTPAVKEDEVGTGKNVKNRCRPGDLWKLGNHRLLCGDATKTDDIEKLIGGGKMDLVLSDPPYGMFLDTDFSTIKGSLKSAGRKNGTKGNKYKKVIGDNDDFRPELITTFFKHFPKVKEMFLFGADYFAELIPEKNSGSWLVWDKRKENQADAIGSEFELCWSKEKHKRRMLRHDWFGFLSSQNSEDARNRVHPTQKPITLLADILTQWGNGLKNVVDLYGGSGSTLIACEQLGKNCYMLEIDPHYCDVIIDRWERMTGKKAKKI